jgi:hypothetical protein
LLFSACFSCSCPCNPKKFSTILKILYLIGFLLVTSIFFLFHFLPVPSVFQGILAGLFWVVLVGGLGFLLVVFFGSFWASFSVVGVGGVVFKKVCISEETI